jgi:hypothetical protein
MANSGCTSSDGELIVGPPPPGTVMQFHCSSAGVATCSAATAVSHALKELVGQFDCVQRSLIFIYVGLEQGPNSFIYRSSSPRASRDQSDLFIEKGDFSDLSFTASR